MTAVLKSVEAWRAWRAANPPQGGSLGCAPTLGGLHEGHFSLVRRSLAENDRTVATIFLNRVQFDSRRDCEAYPADFAEDLAALEGLGVHAVFAPEFDEMYPDGYRYRVTETERSAEGEGACRPGHFDGVLTVVLKLLSLVRPDRAYFGEKDYQQLELVRGMAEAFFIPVEIVACPTVRDADGLALSSRNRRLSPEARARAARFPQALREAATPEEARAALEAAGFEVDYVADRDGRRFGAARLEDVRLIDNLPLVAAARSGRRHARAAP